MNKAMACLLIIAGILAAGGAALADTHVVVQSTRIYMDQETKVTLEYWIAPDRSVRTSPGRATITRDDLGLVWNLDLNAKSYTESLIRKPASPPPRPKPDMRKLWQDFYEPDYSWTIKDTGARKTVSGFDCREFRAAGEADFAEISAAYWVCLTPGLTGGKAFHDYFLGQYRGDSRLAALLKLLEENPEGFCALREEAVENSIAPATRVTTEMIRLEEAGAPPGTYEIPAGFRKVEGRGDR
jgi:hypothetical protein